ncbi:MAG: hypothetical protein J6A89_04885 [Clostridia bacterium]|nr:hypothetical protein [Clostridia bacterium]
MDELSKLETQKAKYINEARTLKLKIKEKEKLLKENEENLKSIEQQIQILEESENEKNLSLLEFLHAQKNLAIKNIDSHKADISDIRSRIHERLESYKQYLEIVKMKKEKIATFNSSVNVTMATHIMNELVKDKKFMEKIGLEAIPGRMKYHVGGKTGFYRAYHNCVRKIKDNAFRIELQAMSAEDYEEATRGNSKHQLCEGKSRLLPKILTGTEKDRNDSKKSLYKILRNKVPQNLVYVPSSKGNKEKGKTKPAYVHKCSPLENFVYFYQEQISKLDKGTRGFIAKVFSDKATQIKEPEQSTKKEASGPEI